MNPIIIIGTGLAGFNLLKELRKLDADRPITLITSDDGMIYSKPMLSAGFGKEKSADDLVMATPEKLESQYNIRVLTHTTVDGIDRDRQQVHTNQHTLDYDQLVLALGADTVKLPLTGDATDRVFSVNDLIDYRRFREALSQDVKDVAIIGGGLIGCEFANDLANGGFNTTLIEPQGRLMPLLLPEALSSVLESGLEALGTQFRYGHFAKAVNSTPSGRCEVVLEDGTSVESDLVVSAVGLRPRISLAETAGLTVNRGIVVDRRLQTNDPNIFALGDCIELESMILPYVMPLMAGARALAKTLTGTPTEVSYGVMPVTVKTPACPLVVNPVMHSEAGDWDVEIDGLNSKAVFTSEHGKKLGYVLMGEMLKEKMSLNKDMPAILE